MHTHTHTENHTTTIIVQTVCPSQICNDTMCSPFCPL